MYEACMMERQDRDGLSRFQPPLVQLDRGIRDLYPGYPALVMATGIISNALHFMEFFTLSRVFFVANLVAYPALMAAILIRLFRHTTALWADLLDPRLVFSFFTIVAAADVLGIQCDLRGYTGAAVALWFFSFLVWVVLLYLSFAVLSFLNTAKDANVVHGGWLIGSAGCAHRGRSDRI
jgi:tellurite resistance protein TehA-like permease